MNKILITPEEMDRIANLFKQSGQQSQDIVSKLNTAIQKLEGEWAGATQQAFIQQYGDDKKLMETYIKTLNLVGDNLTKIAQRFREADMQK